MDRRQFVVALTALAGTGLLGACSSGDDAAPPAPTGPGTTAPSGPLSTWELARRLQALVGTSPDALERRAADAVARRDADAIVAFVRDNVGVLPPPGERADVATATRWGTRGTLRAGAGTLRERVDLLADLLGQAGFEATVKTAKVPTSVTAELLDRARTPAFAIEAKAVEALFAQANLALPAAVFEDGELPPAIDPAPLLALVPAAKRVPTEVAGPSRTASGAVPVVEVTVDGEPRWAFALAPDDTTTTKPADLQSIHAVPTPPVTMTVEVALTAQPGIGRDPLQVEQVLTATWPAADLVGRQVTLAFLPPNDPSLVVRVPRDAIDLRAPIFTVQGWPRSAPEASGGGPGSSTTTVPPTSSPTTSTSTTTRAPRGSTPGTAPAGAPAAEETPSTDELPRYGSIGTTLSRAGGLVALTADDRNPVTAYGEVRLLDDDDRAAARERVATVEATANGGAYPTVTLDVTLVDRDGDPVDGLAAEDLVVTDGGQPQAVTLLSNTADAEVRVVVVYDTSGSIEWPTPTARAEFEATVGAALEQAASQQPFVYQVIGVGGLTAGLPWKDTTAASVSADLAASGSVSSSVWDTLGHVGAQGPSAIVYISDFVADDAPATIEAAKAAVKGAQIPIVCIPVSKVDQAALAAITSLTPGLTVDAADADLAGKIGTFVGDHARQVGRVGYHLRYHVTDAAPGPRTVTVAIKGRDGVRTETSYEVPAADQRAVPPGVGGIYLTITHGSQTSVRRLAGPPRDGRGALVRPAARADVDEAATVLAGLTTVIFEPGAPTTAAMLDDLLASFASLEPLEEPWVKGDVDGVLRAGTDVRRVHGAQALFALADPEAQGQAAVVEGLAVTVVSEVATPEGISIALDVVPELNRSLPRTKDADGFAAALAHSLARSRLESALGAESAAARLAGVPLQLLEPFNASVAAWTEADNAEWRDLLRTTQQGLRLVPVDPKVHALWYVDPATGSIVAVDWSGRGGAMVHAAGADCFAMILDMICALINLWVLLRCIEAAPAGAAGAMRCVGAATAGTFEKSTTVLLLLGAAGGALTGWGSATRDFAAGRIIELAAGAGAGATYGILSSLYNGVGDTAACGGG